MTPPLSPDARAALLALGQARAVAEARVTLLEERLRALGELERYWRERANYWHVEWLRLHGPRRQSAPHARHPVAPLAAASRRLAAMGRAAVAMEDANLTMPDAPVLDALYRLLGHPAFAWFAALVVSVAVIWVSLRLIAHVVARREETLIEGNKVLEQIQVGLAVNTAHQAANVEAQRSVTSVLERIRERLDAHDTNEERRHGSSGAKLDRLLDLTREIRERRERNQE